MVLGAGNGYAQNAVLTDKNPHRVMLGSVLEGISRHLETLVHDVRGFALLHVQR